MKAAALLLLVSCAAGAQGMSPMLSAVSSSMQRVCAVDKDSRQCEVLQELFADQLDVERGKPAMKPAVSPERKAQFREALRHEIAEDQRNLRARD